MLSSRAVTEAVTSLNDAERILQITRSHDPDFFLEWRDALLELTDLERQTLDRLKERYSYYAADNTIVEGTLNIIMLAPLLELGHLCDPPFKLRAEQSVRVTLEDHEMILQGFIDALVIHERFWIIVIESKRYGFNVSFALPQALAYMMANPVKERPLFGLATNGEDYIFIKLERASDRYDFSDKLTLSTIDNRQFYQTFQILKTLKQKIIP
jgi:hypothetical protein